MSTNNNRTDLSYDSKITWKSRFSIKIKLCHACHFQQCGILTSVDSNTPVQPPFKLINSN